MVGLKIDDVRQFTSKLLVGDTFDDFLVREAEINTFNTFSINGHVRQGYYTREELGENRIGTLSSWAVLKPICFSLIKGKKLPGSFQIVLQAAPGQVEQFLSRGQLTVTMDQIKGLYVNIKYEDGKIMCVTGTSIGFFTLDKSLDTEWDEAVECFFKRQGIVFQVD